MPIDHYENFPVASLLLPRRLRGATPISTGSPAPPDIADEGPASDAERQQQLAAFRAELHRIGAEPGATPAPGDPALARIFGPLAATIARHQLPITPFYDLLSAFEQDIAVTRYQDYASLLDYCTRSANPVGRLMLHLFHAASPQNLEQSDAICTGLQLVNFWQDVRLDWHKHRVYLPQEDLRRHGVSDEDLAAARLTPAWRELMAFQVERTRAATLRRSAGAPAAGPHRPGAAHGGAGRAARARTHRGRRLRCIHEPPRTGRQGLGHHAVALHQVSNKTSNRPRRI